MHQHPEKKRVLVVGAGLGTNAGVGLEVPLSHGKYLTDGSGGCVFISAEERRSRFEAASSSFRGFMGEEFSYLWEKDEGYLGNAGFIYGALLQDPSLQVDMLQHAVTEVDKSAVITKSLSFKIDAAPSLEIGCQEEARRDMRQRLDAESEEMRHHGISESYSRSIWALLQMFEYHVVFAGSKGICQLLWVFEKLEVQRKVSVVLLNGAEPSSAMDIGRGSMGPDFAEEGLRFVGHSQIPRLVLTSHGCVASVKLRKQIVAASAALRKTGQREYGQLVAQKVIIYTALDHRRSMPNRESHSLPWSLAFPDIWFLGKGRPGRIVNPDGSTRDTGTRPMPVPLAMFMQWAGEGLSSGVEMDGTYSLGVDTLQQIVQFPGPPRFAEIRIEIAELGCDLGDEQLFHPVELAKHDASVEQTSGSWQIDSHGLLPNGEADQIPGPAQLQPLPFFSTEDRPIFDILFDGQVEAMEVVLKDIHTGLQTPVQDIVEAEGQYATRLVRFFRYYDDRSADILCKLAETCSSASTDTDPSWQDSARWMLEELLAMNKNMGNLLWTGFMTPYTAYTPLKRFGSDLLELVIELEVARIGGYAKSQCDTEHTLEGEYAPSEDLLDEFLEEKIKLLREQRRRTFLAEVDFDNMAHQLQSFEQREDQYFFSHKVRKVEGYVRREFTIDNNVPLSLTQAHLAEASAQIGLAGAKAYHFSNFGHSTGFRFFADGKAWLSAGCEESDFFFLEKLVASPMEDHRNALLALLTQHALEPGHSRPDGRKACKYWQVPSAIVPPGFLARNGYCVVAYRKFGDAGKHFNGLRGGWEHFARLREDTSEGPSNFWVNGFGPAAVKSKVFGQFDQLPLRIGRGATTAKLYLYDVELERRGDEGAAKVKQGVQYNRLSWWEPQLYGISGKEMEDLPKGYTELEPGQECLNFSDEASRLIATFITQFEQELEKAKTLWLASLEADGVKRSSRPFPSLGSLSPEDPELEDLLGAVIQANIAEQKRKQEEAEVKFSMGNAVANAKRVLALGAFHFEQKAEICQQLLRSVGQSASSSKSIFSKAEVVKFMNRSLRTCPLLVKKQTEQTRKSAMHIRRGFFDRLLSPAHDCAFRDERSMRFFHRLADRIEHYNTFTDLQEEVNAILSALAFCS
eukprot:TRINITY_DN17910_c0_g1_i4.p1 TRINITY_DN17910_c0_g1~~TRINITY_DN17910_c0_g1_i4.p1  ORF type:complete len:1138 (-),score=246.49 TRINITY_DN17910_c0_g1_i4:759-4172(-)